MCLWPSYMLLATVSILMFAQEVLPAMIIFWVMEKIIGPATKAQSYISNTPPLICLTAQSEPHLQPRWATCVAQALSRTCCKACSRQHFWHRADTGSRHRGQSRPLTSCSCISQVWLAQGLFWVEERQGEDVPVGGTPQEGGGAWVSPLVSPHPNPCSWATWPWFGLPPRAQTYDC